MRAFHVFFFLALAACTQFPELDGTVAPDLENADFPALVPLDTVRSISDPLVADPVATTETLNARVAALRARARALQSRPILDPATRARLRRGVS